MSARLAPAEPATDQPVRAPHSPSPWWRTAVVYQVYLRSFADSNGDGIGDLAELRSRLPYLAWLGVDAVWINPHYPSGGADGGYDVVDYRAVDPDYGDVSDLEALVQDARRLGLRVVLDVVPNHTSDRHPWFRAALADPDSPRGRALPLRPSLGGTAEQLAIPVRRPSVVPYAGRPVVPSPVRPRAAGPELAGPGRGRRLREDPALLARPRRQRLPCRRGVRLVQGRTTAGQPRRILPHPVRPRSGAGDDLEPARGARRLAALAVDLRRVPGHHARRRGLPGRPRRGGVVLAAGRAAPVVVVPAAQVALVGGVLRRGRAVRARRLRAGRRPGVLGPRQPRQGPTGQPLRGRAGGDGPGPRRGTADARAPRLGLRVRRRRAGAAPGRGARRGEARPDLLPQPRRPHRSRRVPRPDSVERLGGRGFLPRRGGRAMAADPFRVAELRRLPADQGRRIDAAPVPPGAGPAGGPPGARLRRRHGQPARRRPHRALHRGGTDRAVRRQHGHRDRPGPLVGHRPAGVRSPRALLRPDHRPAGGHRRLGRRGLSRGQGSPTTLPGLNRSSGSRACLTANCMACAPGSSSCRIPCRLSRPMPCSPLSVPH